MVGMFKKGSSIEILGVRCRIRWVLSICVSAMISVRTAQVDL